MNITKIILLLRNQWIWVFTINIMDSLTNLNNYKKSKKIAVVVADLAVILKVINLSINALKLYSKYISVMEIVSVLSNNKTLLEIQHNKYKKMLEELNG